tara:strand:- start:6050 stop:6619 length:570 start_codon:yes stop_codon:yes gene_type:complete
MKNNTKKKAGCSCQLNFFNGGKAKKENMRKTKKKTHTVKGIVVFSENKHDVNGIIHLEEKKTGLEIDYEITGLSDGLHGFHIHEYGDLSEGCNSACSHFNPLHKTHGGPNSEHRHEGDLGNVYSKGKMAKGSIFAKGLCLQANSKMSVLGRMIIVHEREDDLGEGGDEESLKTGNAGGRLACGVIGLKK